MRCATATPLDNFAIVPEMTPIRTFLFGVLAWLGAAVGYSKPLVVTTHTVLSDFVHEIAGDDVEVTCLLPVNIDPHSYDPRPADVRAVSRAALVVMNGLGLEPWAERLVAAAGYKGAIVVATDGLEGLLPLSDHEEHGHAGRSGENDALDPHAWQDLRNAKHYVQKIANALCQVVPSRADAFRSNAAAYEAKLDALDAEVRREIDSIPSGRRKLVTSHDSLQYLGNRYGLRIVPVAGSRPGQEPSARQLAELISTVRREHVPAVFFEATSNPKLAELVAKEAGVTVVRELYTDSLGPTGSPGATYLGMFRHNIATLVAALK
ncbi:metal ABC transporter substrate-binding protein [Opitutaceae bacterium EW11]|nr:metal ABC transporter substrate-binding protein [Opitutaceae bacterium EW11]